MSKQVYVALKRFGGGKRLRNIYGAGVGKLVQRGQEILEEHMTEQHRNELVGMRLIEAKEPGKVYQTQADRDRSWRNAQAGNAKAARDSAAMARGEIVLSAKEKAEAEAAKAGKK